MYSSYFPISESKGVEESIPSDEDTITHQTGYKSRVKDLNDNERDLTEARMSESEITDINTFQLDIHHPKSSQEVISSNKNINLEITIESSDILSIDEFSLTPANRGYVLVGSGDSRKFVPEDSTEEDKSSIDPTKT